MSITGSLADFSLSEILKLIHKGDKTGVLMLCASPQFQATLPLVHYIWVYKGRLVAVANRLDQQGLLLLIEQYEWISSHLLKKIAQLCPANQPLGLCLNNQGILQTKQLKHLFQIQVLQQVGALFQLKEGQFKFEQNVPMPMREMTGLSLPAVALNQYSLIKVLLEEIENRCLNLTETIQFSSVGREDMVQDYAPLPSMDSNDRFRLS
jgi:hypothetical protein